MTTPNPLDGPRETLMPDRQLAASKRQRRPGRRRRKRPTTTETMPSFNNDNYNMKESNTRPPSSSGEPTFDYRISGEERDKRVRPLKTALPSVSGDNLNNYKQLRRPYSAIRKDSDSDPESSNSDLKSLLKSAGGSLSLSEVLQQKNISLADLLNKKQHALAALTKSSEASPTTTRMDLNSGEMMMTGEDDMDAKKPRRVPTFVAMPPHVYPTEEVRPTIPQSPPTIATESIFFNKRIPGPSVNSKPIKEVVSRIRPDFSNSRRPSTESNGPTAATSRPR